MHKNIVLTLISNTLIKEFRSKTLMFLLVFTLGIIILVSTIFKFFFGASDGPMAATLVTGLIGGPFVIFYYIISIWNGILAIVLGVNCIKSDTKCSVMPQLLSLPINRFDYLFSRIIGSWLIILIYYIFSLCLGAIIFSITLETFTFNPIVFLALFYASFSMLFIIMVSAFFSLYFPKLIAFFATLFLNSFISASGSYFIKHSFTESLQDLNFIKVLGLIFYWLFPRIGNINEFASSIITGKKFAGDEIHVLIHFVITFALFTFIFTFFFKRKEV